MSRWSIRTYDSRIVHHPHTINMIYTFKFIQMDLKTVTIVAIMVAVAVIGFKETEARPSYGQVDSWSPLIVERRTAPACEGQTDGVRELCQRCAKVTKSRLAYTMCCEEEEDTREWCGKFLSFGITSLKS